MNHFISSDPWPNAIDATATVAFLAVVMLLPAMGYVFMVLDFRAYLRSLRRSLVTVGHYVTGIPGWARAETPRALAAFGLSLPCTEEELKRAYRSRVKRLHPDHGGDQRRFMLLQVNFEEALAIVASESRSDYPRWSTSHRTG